MGYPRAFLEGVALPPVPTLGSVWDKQRMELGFRNAWPRVRGWEVGWWPVPARPSGPPGGCAEPAGRTAGLGLAGAPREKGRK